jgi:hypothetical protein
MARMWAIRLPERAMFVRPGIRNTTSITEDNLHEARMALEIPEELNMIFERPKSITGAV